MNGEKFNMEEKNREEEKLTEAGVAPMANPTNPAEVPPATPAAPSEVQAAANELDVPQGAEGALVGEDATVDPANADPNAIPPEGENDQFVTATAEILIPADALNTAAAMTSGDTGDAGADMAPGATAPEVTAPEGSVVSDVTGVTADEMQPTNESVEVNELDAIRESLTDDDLRMILEYRKYKEGVHEEAKAAVEESEENGPEEVADPLKESEETTIEESTEEKEEEKIEESTEEEVHEDEGTDAMGPLPEPDPMPEVGPDPRPDEAPEETGDEEVKDAKELNFDDITVEGDETDIDHVFDDSDLNKDDLDALLGEDEDIDTEELESFLGDDVALEDVPDALRTSADFLDYVLSDREDEGEHEDKEEGEGLNFDDINEGFKEDEDDVPVAEDEEELDERVEKHVSESYKSYTSKFSEAMDTSMLRYPSGTTSPGTSEIKASQAEEELHENLVKDYQDHVREQKKAISNFRTQLKENRNKNAAKESKEVNEGNKFNEALKASSRSSRINENSSSWVNNTFIEKYNESQKLDFKKLLENGFLG